MYLEKSVKENGGGGIRTHGALADTLVFKIRWCSVIPMDLIVLGETKNPKVDHLLIYVNSLALTAVGKSIAASCGSSKRFIY